MTDFEHFFETEWNRLLKELPDRKDLFSNGESLRNASWDRKAAYLVWCATDRNEYTYAKGNLADLATAPKCAVCGERQYETPSGMTCPNGHGGAPSAPEPDVGPPAEPVVDPFDIL